MILIVCLDDKNGMAFNKRRQSKDSALRARILKITSGSRLYMNEYSLKQFEEEKSCILAVASPLTAAKAGDYCFIETDDASAFEKDIEKIIVYRWNRVYPADLKFGICFENGWKKISSFDFEGKSHEKITEEVYE
jgi:hypothetical protein